MPQIQFANYKNLVMVFKVWRKLFSWQRISTGQETESCKASRCINQLVGVGVTCWAWICVRKSYLSGLQKVGPHVMTTNIFSFSTTIELFAYLAQRVFRLLFRLTSHEAPSPSNPPPRRLTRLCRVLNHFIQTHPDKFCQRTC